MVAICRLFSSYQRQLLWLLLNYIHPLLFVRPLSPHNVPNQNSSSGSNVPGWKWLARTFYTHQKSHQCFLSHSDRHIGMALPMVISHNPHMHLIITLVWPWVFLIPKPLCKGPSGELEILSTFLYVITSSNDRNNKALANRKKKT